MVSTRQRPQSAKILRSSLGSLDDKSSHDITKIPELRRRSTDKSLLQRPSTAPKERKRGRTLLVEGYRDHIGLPLSPVMRLENEKSQSILQAIDTSESRVRERRSLSPSPTRRGEEDEREERETVLKAKVAEELTEMTRTLKDAIKMHNNFIKSGGAAGTREGERARQANGRKEQRSRPKSAPAGGVQQKRKQEQQRQQRPNRSPSPSSPTSKKERPTKNLELEIEQRMFLESRNIQQRARPKSAMSTMGRGEGEVAPGTGTVSGVTPGRIRPKSAALLERAREKGVSVQEKAMIVMEMLGSKEGNTLAACLMDANVKKEIRNYHREKRELKTRRIQAKKKRINEKRIEDILAKQWELRAKILREENRAKAESIRKAKGMLVYVALASRFIHMRKAYYGHFDGIEKIKRENHAAEVITRLFRLFVFRQYRLQVKGAIGVLGAFFVLRIKLWKLKRKRGAIMLIRDFLSKVDEENKRTGGLFRLVAKGAEIKAMKKSVTICQHVWRQKVLFTDAQVKFINQQWQNHEDEVIKDIVREESESEILALKPHNLEIDRKNVLRRTMKKKPLARILPRSLKEVNEDVLKRRQESLFFEVGRCCPVEVRLAIVRGYLKEIKKVFMEDLKRYKIQFRRWKKAMKVFERRGDLNLNSFLKNQERKFKRSRKRRRTSSFSMTDVGRTTKESPRKEVGNGQRRVTEKPRFLKNKSAEDELNEAIPTAPIEPVFHTILDDCSLNILIQAGLDATKEMKERWSPSFGSRSFNTVGKESSNLLLVRGREEIGKEVAHKIASHLRSLNDDGFAF